MKRVYNVNILLWLVEGWSYFWEVASPSLLREGHCISSVSRGEGFDEDVFGVLNADCIRIVKHNKPRQSSCELTGFASCLDGP